MRKNDEIVLDIIDLSNEGLGIGKVDGFPIFVKGAIIGDRIRAGITKLKKNFGYARILSIIEPSAYRSTGLSGGFSLRWVSASAYEV